MSLLNKVIKEAAQKALIEQAAAGAVSAGAVAGVRAPLGATTADLTTKKKKKKKLRRRRMPKGFSFSESVQNQKFDQADVISKLKSAENKADHEDDTRGFALEDEEGRIVKVFVSADQADDFEAALGVALAGEEDELSINNDETNSMEIAEVLFNLKDRFTIVDVEWPQVEEDEEQEVEGQGDDAEGELSDDLEGGEEGEGDDLDMEAELQGDEEGLGDEELGEPEGDDPMSALSSIIDLLKTQADAQKAEAQAKEAEANAEEAKYNADAAEAKVKNEEEVLDMEAYYDEKNQADKEAKKLAKLAKWKHETAQEAEKELGDDDDSADPEDFDVSGGEEDFDGNEENEESNVFTPPIDKNKNRKLEPGEFIKYMFKSIQGGN